MAKKRKMDSSKASETTEPPLKQQQQEQPPMKEERKEEEEEQQQQQVVANEEAEEEDEEVVANEEAEEEDEDDHDEEEGDDEESPGNNSNQIPFSLSAVAETSNSIQDVAGDDEDEPILKLLEPFSKDQLIGLLFDAAEKHVDVAEKIRTMADADPSHRKIFVHGLGWDTTTETLISVFRQYGEIEDCKAVFDKVSGKSKGYGFILFKKRSGARKALKEPQKKIGSRITACQLASVGPVPAPNVPQPVQAHPLSDHAMKKIYVSNVGADLDPQKLHSFFSEFGEIEEGPLGLDKATGKPKGFCLFIYKTAESARKALEEPHKNFEGHVLHCQKAIEGPKAGKPQYPHPHPHHSHSSHFQRNKNPNYVGGHGHLMAPATGIGFHQGAAAPQQLNPALGQALTALIATQGAGLGLTNLLGALGSAAAVNPGVHNAGHGIQGGFGNQVSIRPGVIGGYANQGGVQGAYPNQQIGQGGTGRGQHGVGQYGGPGSFMGH